MTEPTTVEEPVEEVKEKKRMGKKPYVLTAAARDYDRALAHLAKLTKGNDKVEKAKARLDKAQKDYDAAVAEAEKQPEGIDEAREAVVAAKAQLDQIMAAQSSPE